MIFRFCVLVVLAAVVCQDRSAAQSGPQTPRTYVIVHGAWGGGWDWRRIDSVLSAQGNRVYRVTLTGLGERVHLATPSIGLSTHISDVVNTLRWEELTNVVLVGHSYGGMVITGAVDQVPERIHHLFYVDAFLPDSGESVGLLTKGSFDSFIAQNTVAGMIQAPWESPTRPVPKDVPQPLKTFTDTLVLVNRAARRLGASYILTMDKGATEDQFSSFAARAANRGWPVYRLEANHTPERSAIPELAALLRRVP